LTTPIAPLSGDGSQGKLEHMWADAETDIDFLNYSEVAELVTELITDSDLLPISLGVFGGWGTGKSSTLKLVEVELQKRARPPIIVKFDAWLYQDYDDARAALMSVIASTLLEAAPTSLKGKALDLIKRIDTLRLLGLAVEAGAWAIGLPTFGAAAKGVNAIGHVLQAKGDNDDVAAIKEGAKAGKELFKGLVKPKSEKGPPGEIDAFRREFEEVLAGFDQSLVVFIDNLDRCLPANAIHTLEAVRLFLFIPRTAFVIAADEDMIRHAVADHFKQPGERHVSDYLDKLIQLPVRVPRIGVQEVTGYLYLLFAGRAGVGRDAVEALRGALIDRLRRSWSGEEPISVEEALRLVERGPEDSLRQAFEMAERMAPLLARSSRVLGNPRIVKRLLNVVRMRSMIAQKRSMPLDEAVIAKLALFERCTDEASSEALHTAINQAEGGRPDVLKRIETGQPISESDRLPDAWSKHLPFLKEWASLDPKLGGMDLRPAVYLARETVPLQITRSSASIMVVNAVQTLLKVPSISSPAGRDAINAVPEHDHPTVMEGIVAEMRKNSEWSRARTDFRGAFLLAERSTSTRSILARFIRSLQLSRIPPWMSVMLKDSEWWEMR
jgi:predicted KAP-like P-loop ATPase